MTQKFKSTAEVDQLAARYGEVLPDNLQGFYKKLKKAGFKASDALDLTDTFMTRMMDEVSIADEEPEFE